MILRPSPATPADGPVLERFDARSSSLGGGLTIRRALPNRPLRRVGPWVFLDHFGPLKVRGGEGMDVAPHPHIGLQTVTWLLQGRILHKDSLGYEQLIRPGQLNWMTAGRGIAHSEETPVGEEGTMHGVQLWLALPDAHRHIEPAFEHHPALPRLVVGPSDVTVLAGTFGGLTSPATTHSPMVALDVPLPHDAPVELALDEGFEHAILPVRGVVTIEGEDFAPGQLAYLGTRRPAVTLTGPDAHAVLIGGEPLREDILLWWNFVARSGEEMEAARAAWQAGTLAGPVEAYEGDRLDAPPLP